MKDAGRGKSYGEVVQHGGPPFPPNLGTFQSQTTCPDEGHMAVTNDLQHFALIKSAVISSSRSSSSRWEGCLTNNLIAQAFWWCEKRISAADIKALQIASRPFVAMAVWCEASEQCR
jgi:hypothetical protein